jgi:hypothetical protein
MLVLDHLLDAFEHRLPLLEQRSDRGVAALITAR